MATKMDIRVPDLGEFSDVEIIEVLVQPGASVSREDGLITLETDKATMDVPSPENGVIESITVTVGDTVSTGDVIGSMTVGDGDAVASPAATELPTIEEAEAAEGVADDAAPSGKAETITVPDLGDFSDVDVIEVHIGGGDSVGVEDPLITLETDKATMDVPSPLAGTVQEVLVGVGDKVSAGSPVALVSPGASGAAPAQAASTTPKAAAAEPPRAPTPTSAPVKTPTASAPDAAAAPAAPAELPAIDEAGFSRAHASPSVRKLARELGVDLARVKGSGPKDRVLHDDVKGFVKAILSGGAAAPAAQAAALPAVPEVDFARFGEIETVALTRIQKISGPRLQASWINLPHVTQHDLADITDLENRRQKLKGPAKERGISLTPLAFVMKAVIATLKEFPKANASLSPDGKSLVLKKYCHLGFAADTENGLMVPVIRDADQMDIYELAQQLGELSMAARDGKLKADQMQGASFTITSLGGIGGTAFTPIVNAPEVAILGVSRSSMQPVWNGESFEPRLMLPLSLSYDHRVIDGAYAVRFTTFLSQALTNVEALLEAIP